MKKFFKYFIFFFVFAACTTQKQAEKYFNAHDELAAQFCETKFPIDTITKIITIDSTHKADNKDYTSLIDSLQTVIDALPTEPETVFVSDSAAVVYWKQQYLKLIKDSKQEINSIKEQYKPCKPDTTFITQIKTVVDSRKVAIANDELNKEKSKAAKTHWWKMFWFWWALIATSLLLIKIFLNKILSRL